MVHSVVLGVLGIFDCQEEFFIDFFNFLDHLLEVIIINGQEGGHGDEFLNLGVVVSIVIELIQAIGGFLGLSEVQKAVLNLFLLDIVNGLGHQLGQLFGVVIVNRQIIQVHNKQVEYLLMLNIVPSHLVKTLLRLDDKVYQVQYLEPVIDVQDQLR